MGFGGLCLVMGRVCREGVRRVLRRCCGSFLRRWRLRLVFFRLCLLILMGWRWSLRLFVRGLLGVGMLLAMGWGWVSAATRHGVMGMVLLSELVLVKALLDLLGLLLAGMNSVLGGHGGARCGRERR
ncbi:hypothetical protein F4861DRAFT_510361 [Xylaria intraflava]|nr:hypothetical protein F4861DRAFT_510361 [Xylaria intraflava]